jgi:hypothetical protein
MRSKELSVDLQDMEQVGALDLIHGSFARKGGVIIRELSQGQNTVYL